MITDCELLRRYIEQDDEAAFAEVVRRQTNLVYSVALRASRNPQIAEEVTQVFLQNWLGKRGCFAVTTASSAGCTPRRVIGRH